MPIQRIYFKQILFLLAAAVILSACHSRKLTQRPTAGGINDMLAKQRGPYIMVKPDKDIADKYANIMQVKRNDIQNGRLYNFIEEWTGVPYRFGGMGKDGIDCSGLVSLLQLQVYDQPVPRTTAQQANAVKRKYEDELKEGDLVFFDFDGKQFSHVGIYLQNGYIVHASTRKGVLVVRLHDRGIYQYFSRAGSIIDTAATN